MRALRLVHASLLLLSAGVLVACGGDDASDGGIPKASYAAETLTGASEVGQVYGFNSAAYVSLSAAHGWAITDLETRVFTQILPMHGFVGFDDAGDLLYTGQLNGVGAEFAFLRHANGVVEQLPGLPERGGFQAFALTPSGDIWGFTGEPHEGAALTPGYAKLRDGVVSDFHDFSAREPDGSLTLQPRGVDEAGDAVFCQTLELATGGNGLPKTECWIATADGKARELLDAFDDAYRVVPLPITASGNLAGAVGFGRFGLDGDLPFFFDGEEGTVLGDRIGDVRAVNDRGDVIFTQLGSAQPLRLRGAGGDVSDLSDYVRSLAAPNAEVTGIEILAINPDGLILATQTVTTSEQNVILLTPQ